MLASTLKYSPFKIIAGILCSCLAPICWATSVDVKPAVPLKRQIMSQLARPAVIAAATASAEYHDKNKASISCMTITPLI